MITPEMEAMYAKLSSLAGTAIVRNDADDYLALVVNRRIVVSVLREWTSFSTEDEQLLERLKAGGIVWSKHPSSDPKYKHSHVFPGLTPEMVDEHSEDFRKLIEQSMELKQHRV